MTSDTKKTVNHINNQLVEFSLSSDPFSKARKKGVTRWILKHVFKGSNKIFITIVLFTTVISSMLSSSTLIFVGEAINQFVQGNWDSLLFYSIVILILGLSAPVMRLFNFMMREVLAQRLERDSRQEFYVNLLGKSQSFHDQQKIGDLMARTTDDVRTLNLLISPAVSLILESFTSLIVPIIYIYLFYPLPLLVPPICFTILFIIALKDYTKKISPVTGALRYEFGNMNSILNESLSGIALVKSTVKESIEKQKYLSKIKNYRDAFVLEGKLQAKYLPILFLGIMNTIGLGIAINLYLNDSMSVGQIISYIGLLSQLSFPTNISYFVFALVKLAGAGAKRLLEIMNNDTEIDENIEGTEKQIEGNVKFENVWFKYPGYDNFILKNMTFQVKPGQTVAIAGTTGSGKTTLTKLISRLYDVNKGRILVDGVDVKDFSLKSLRKQVNYIEQDIFLFSNKIIENISFGRESSREDIITAAKNAQADDFISRLPKGYDTEIGERGVQLSGGERQRIAIARAFLTNPRILVLDDSTSAIDSETEDKIQRAIRNILVNRTTFLITHRLSQIRWADLIIVLKRGQIEALGTHEELIKSSEEYRKIFVKRFDIDEQSLLKEVNS
ncbi:MAG: ABC transporter ATP-binding protein [Candidatus Lokiarchaeota archaeon]|nr:ABC transporter ATP-binding protein [Candidatus Lokiarchaeota archaeon]